MVLDTTVSTTVTRTSWITSTILHDLWNPLSTANAEITSENGAVVVVAVVAFVAVVAVVVVVAVVAVIVAVVAVVSDTD